MRKKPKLKKIANKYAGRLRHRMTGAERCFKKLLSKCGVYHVSQKVIYNGGSFYIIDFFLPNKNLCVELDGEYHLEPEQAAKDEKRDTWLLTNGYYVWRMTNQKAMELDKDSLTAYLNTLPDVNRKIKILPYEEPVVTYKPVKHVKRKSRKVRVKKKKRVSKIAMSVEQAKQLIPPWRRKA